MKHSLFAAVFLFAGWLPPFFASAEEEPFAEPAPVVGIGEVSPVRYQISRRYSGQIVSCSVIRIVTRCSGEILEVGFHDGDRVKAGQMLYRLDPVQYESAAQNAEARVAECKAKLQNAHSSYDRNKRLFEQKAVSREDLDNAKADYDSATALLASAEAELVAAKDNLEKTVITAPGDGQAGVTNYTRGNYVTPESETLVTIVQTSPIRVRFAVSYADYLSLFGSPESLKQDGIVEISLADGTEYSETGTVELLNNEINPQTDSILVYANFENKDSKLISGGIVQVVLRRASRTESMAVAPSAVVYDNTGSFVYVLDGENRAEKRYVKTGHLTETEQIIEEGVHLGETVVIKGTHKVEPGMAVSPQK